MGISHSRNREKKFESAVERNFETIKIPPDIASQPKEKTNQNKDVVFSGLSCRLPESANIAEFRDNLINGIDMVTEDNRRWEPGIYGLPRGNGKLKDIDKFDNEFFGVSPKQANVMDPQLRILHEVAYEALVDAGQCPELLRGSNIGVFIGASISESHEAWGRDPETVSGYMMTGCYKSMFANRLSYFFDFKGPSFVVDSACSSGCVALHTALKSICSGECDAALVGGSNLCLKPLTSLQFQKLGMQAADGRCKPFDAKVTLTVLQFKADGYSRSEAVVALFLQKAKDAKRIYCHLVNTGTNSDGYKPQGITYPSCKEQLNLLESVYDEVGLDPSLVTYVEAHGTGTQAGDYEETKALAEFFCSKRFEPLPIGSTKSNMGHSEAASGLASIVKVIIAMEEGVVPGNLHFNEPNPNIPELQNGKLKVVSKNIEWKGGVVGINSFGFGGSNCHVILKSHDTKGIQTCPNKDKKLFCGFSRSEEGIKKILQQAEKESTDDQFLTFLSEAISSQTDVSMYRGFKVLNSSTDLDCIAVCEKHDKRPIWYVFTGMGCQWPGMGCQMMSMDVFKKSILKCEAAVFPYGIKLSKILTSLDESMYEDVVQAFVAITAIQVALVDLLRCVGVEPDGLIGHSIGEIGCAYADGCFSAEEAVLVAYWRGRCIKKAMLPPGAMAVVGLTWEEVSVACPDGVVPACHNAADSVTVSGPKQVVEDFAEDLRKKDIFAKEVNSVGIAFHSYFMKTVETSLYEMFCKVIKHRKERSSKWISTSVKQANWDTDLAKHSAPEYHVNNILSPVLFHDALQHVPDNAIVIEIAPHCLLRPILKRSLPKDCYITGLMQRSNDDNVQFCLSSMGNMFLQGAFLSPHLLLQPARYPLKHGTPMISPLNTWKHDDIWGVPSPDIFVQSTYTKSKGFCYEIDTAKDSEFKYLSGHKIDGRVLFPAAGYLLLAWKSFLKLSGQSSKDMPIAFENIRFHRVTVLSETVKEKFNVVVSAGTGFFEIIEAGSVVASGRILELNSPMDTVTKSNDKIPSDMVLSSDDVYKEFRLRGYEYEGLFKGIVRTDLDCKTGLLRWSGNFVTFLDSMLQMITLSRCERDLRLPTSVKSISLDPKNLTTRLKDEEVDVEVNTKSMECTSGGVSIKGLVLNNISRRKDNKQPMIQTCKLLPHDRAIHISTGTFELQYANLCMQLASRILTSLSTFCQRNTITALLTELKADINVSEQLPEEIQEKYSSKGFTLLRAFRTFLEVGTTQVIHLAEVHKQHCHNFKKALIDDTVFSAKRSPDILKALIETVVENNGDNIRVLELGAANMKEEIEKQLNDYGNVKYSYEVLEKTRSNKPSLSSNATSKTDLIVVNNMLHFQRDLQAFLQDIVNLLDDNGFALIKETTKNFLLYYTINGFQEEDLGNSEHEIRKFGLFYTVEMLKHAFQTIGLLCIYEVHHPFLYSVFLLRKPFYTRSGETKIIDVSDLDCQWLENLTETLGEAKETQNRHIWLYADNCYSGIIGMVKCLMKEQDGHNIRCVLNKMQKKDMTKEEVVNRLIERNLTFNIVTDDGLACYRFLPFIQEMEFRRSSGYSYLDIVTYGDLTSLKWFQTSKEKFKQNASHEICKVEMASLNFRDLMLASGKLNPDAIPRGGMDRANNCLLGIEFSGTNPNGDRVMGIVPAKAFATHVDAHKKFLWMVRDDWSFADAASVPVAYSTAYYALIVRGRLEHGQTVLIHSGSGGVGQAAIRIAKSLNCEIFTTVGTNQKRAYLLSVFPELKPENIFSSRDTAFEMEIMNGTSGKGVDVVLNSLSGRQLLSSLNVVARHGRFLEIGKVDLFSDSELGMSIFLKNISFHGILLDSLFEDGNSEWDKVYQLVEEGIKSHVVMPLDTTVFDIKETEAAFRYMGKGKHIGKILIQIGNNSSSEDVQAIPRIVCDSQKSYVIIGGLGGFGLELAEWLANRGARSITLTSRSGVTNGYQARKVNLLKSMGVDVVVSRKNAGKFQEAEEIIKECTKPCGGIFNTAMVLEDGILQNQTVERFKRVIEPKLSTAVNLDKITRQLCWKTCEWFVMFSSVCSGRGNAGQANYGFANSGMERLCEERARDGLHGLAIQWGVIGDVGFVFEKQCNDKIDIAGVIPQSIQSCLDTLELFMTQSAPMVTSFVQARKRSVQNRFTEDQNDCLLTRVCNVIGINDYSKVDKRSPLEKIGVDSLMTVEIKQTIDRMTDFRLKIEEIRRLTMQDIHDMDMKCFRKNLKLDTGNDANGSVFTLDDVLVPADIILPLNNGKGNGDPLYIVHMIQGTTEILRHMSSFIDRPVFGIQCTKDVPLNSVTDMATYYIQVILEHTGDRNFHLAGYSFGGMISLEIGHQIQTSEHHSDKLLSMTLLDGTHFSVSTSIRIVQENFGIKDEESRKTISLAILGSLLLQKDLKRMWGQLHAFPSFEERVDIILAKLADKKLVVSREKWLEAVERYKERNSIACSYKFPGTYRGDVMLITPEHWTVERETLGPDQGLEKIVDGSVKVYSVPGRHLSFLKGKSGEQVAKYINENTKPSKNKH